eukprot:CAMPEP_0172653622 /NCGR_PEP_ID=MMETSP1068-20121228/243919_1 /TAXON_ID=35684 /ORGANISM="Pseudopedinella elastica, Strain CCMP716" /LENGTH=578 /DNA_ID=CAMNT_0013468057 /DNA_START=42 /DNA_END=1775 /DNA_ORIENTATION=-
MSEYTPSVPWTPENAKAGKQLLTTALDMFSPDPKQPKEDAEDDESLAPSERDGAPISPESDSENEDNEAPGEAEEENPTSGYSLETDFMKSGRFMCLDVGRRAEEGAMGDQVIGEEQGEELGLEEGEENDCEEAEEDPEPAGGATGYEKVGADGGLSEGVETDEEQAAFEAGPDEDKENEPEAAWAQEEIDMGMLEMQPFTEKTKAAAARAADVQARVQKFLADVRREPVTVPKTPQVLKNSSKYHKVVKSSEELELEAALLAQAELKAVNRKKFAKSRRSAAPAPVDPLQLGLRPKCRPRAGRPPSGLHVERQTVGEAECPPQRSALSVGIDARLQALHGEAHAGLLQRGGTREEEGADGAQAFWVRGWPGDEHAEQVMGRLGGDLQLGLGGAKPFTARPMPDFAARRASGVPQVKKKEPTVPKSPGFAPRPASKQNAAPGSAHVTKEDCDKFLRNCRKETSQELARAMESGRHRPRVTVPCAPSFMDKASGRAPAGRASTGGLTTREAADLAEMEAHQFKARPLDRAVFEGAGCRGVPTVKSRGPTVPDSPQVLTRSKAAALASAAAEEPPPPPPP